MSLLHVPLNNASTTVAATYTPGSGQLQVADGTVFGSPSPTSPVRVSVVRGTNRLTILSVVGRTDDTLTIGGVLEGFSDVPLQSGDKIGAYVTAGTVSEIHSYLGELDSSISAASALIAAVDGDVETLQGQIATIQGQVSTIDGDVSALETDVSAIQGQVSTIDGLVADLEGSVTTIQGQISTIDGSVTTLQGSVAGKADASTVSALDGRLTTAEGDIDTLQAASSTYLTSSSNLDASKLTTGTVATDRLGVGIASSATYLRGDGVWVSCVDLNSNQTIGGIKTFTSTVKVAKLGVGSVTPTAGVDIGDGQGLNIRNSSNSVVSAFDSNGYGFVCPMVFSLGRLVDLVVGTNLTKSGHIAGWAGVISKIKVQASTNGSSGGFSLTLNKNGSSVATMTVANSTTTVQSFTPTTTSVSENDVFTIDCTSVGSGVQTVVVTVYLLVKNQ